jgi:hypothetical protein
MKRFEALLCTHGDVFIRDTMFRSILASPYRQEDAKEALNSQTVLARIYFDSPRDLMFSVIDSDFYFESDYCQQIAVLELAFDEYGRETVRKKQLRPCGQHRDQSSSACG